MAEPAASPPGPTVHISIPLTEKPGDKIGHYKLLEQIGEGGCGVVYMAEQTEPIRRRVAFKVIKLGTDTKQVIARFEAERQALPRVRAGRAQEGCRSQYRLRATLVWPETQRAVDLPGARFGRSWRDPLWNLINLSTAQGFPDYRRIRRHA
jgi:hypothetical protein